MPLLRQTITQTLLRQISSHFKHESDTNAPTRSRERKADDKAVALSFTRFQCRPSDIYLRPTTPHPPSNASQERKFTSAQGRRCDRHARKHKRSAQPDNCFLLIQEPQIAQPKKRGHTFPPTDRMTTLDIFPFDLFNNAQVQSNSGKTITWSRRDRKNAAHFELQRQAT